MVRIEFLGLARVRFGQTVWECPAQNVAELIARMHSRFPQALPTEQLPAHWLLCRNGREFLRSPEERLNDGDCILVLPADAGG
ncbi:MAG: hypothetical protein D6725_08830 [Planctomycetota bacterium]|nr:MAG: hypothetical protein D6725_08830 [Planctomycetota bacterium]